MAKKYIDAETLIAELDASCMPIFEKGISGILGDNESIADVIRSQPAADVQEVVRCRDCEYRKTEDCAMQYECECGAHYFWDSDNAFCSRGRRKDGDPDAE